MPRLLPGVIIVALQWLLRFLLPLFDPELAAPAIGAGAVGLLAVLIWWIFFSRVSHMDRWFAIAVMALGVALTPRILDKSLVNGMMGMMFPIFAMPVLSLALVAGAAAGRNLSAWPRRGTMAAALLAGCGVFALLRTGGIDNSAKSDFAWRWTPTPEEKLLAAQPVLPVAPAAAPAVVPVAAMVEAAPVEVAPVAVIPNTVEIASEWPGFRGPLRNGSAGRVAAKIATDWKAAPPKEVWRKKIGPGWSSFAVRGELIYTQEQRGESEVVSCYKLASGEPVWVHKDGARFWESNAGAGPRSTPTLAGGRVYAMGATGILNALDAATGAVYWSRNVAEHTGAKVPEWGFAGSPLVVGGAVIAAAGGHLGAYEAASGKPLWSVDTGGGGYGSPQLAAIDGVEQVVLIGGDATTGVSPEDGKVLWKHAWDGSAILQPAILEGGGMLVAVTGAAGGLGTRRLAVAKGPGGWTAEEKWTSRGLKPYFNDSVVHKGHAYGFDGSILSCIDLQDGQRKWKGGRYGSGQMLLLPEQDLLLVLAEQGDIALVKAGPAEYAELARMPALEGKTWNHPVVVGNLLLVRNGEEMVAFRLPAA